MQGCLDLVSGLLCSVPQVLGRRAPMEICSGGVPERQSHSGVDSIRSSGSFAWIGMECLRPGAWVFYSRLVALLIILNPSARAFTTVDPM